MTPISDKECRRALFPTNVERSGGNDGREGTVHEGFKKDYDKIL